MVKRVFQVPQAHQVHLDRGERRVTRDKRGREDHVGKEAIEVLWDHQEIEELRGRKAKLDSRGKGETKGPLACRETKAI